jgi:trimethylamine---corrinoid protein Co-methyltransferase
VKYHSQKALDCSKANGARVDHEKKIAHIPKELVEQALATAPKSFVLGARNPAHNYPLPSPISRYAMDGTAAFAQDFHTGQRHYGCDKDNELAMRVFQRMDMGVMAWAPSPPKTGPRYTRPLYEWFTTSQILLQARAARIAPRRTGRLPGRGVDRHAGQRRSAQR